MNLEEEMEELQDVRDETIRISSDPTDSTEEKDHESGDGPGRLASLRSRFGSARILALAGSAALFMALSGALLFWILSPSGETSRSAEGSGPAPPAARSVDACDRNVTQELGPFYIPLPAGGNGRMARVTFSVTWDASSSKRFQDRETLARDRVYHRIKELAEAGGDMRTMSLTVRSETLRILEELLRPDELRLVVTGIFIV